QRDRSSIRREFDIDDGDVPICWRRGDLGKVSIFFAVSAQRFSGGMSNRNYGHQFIGFRDNVENAVPSFAIGIEYPSDIGAGRAILSDRVAIRSFGKRRNGSAKSMQISPGLRR